MAGTTAPVALWEGQPVTLGTVTATGVVGPKFSFATVYSRRYLTVAALQNGGTGSTVTGQLQASLDGTNFFNVGSSLTLGGSGAANAQSVSVDGLEGAVFQLNISAYTAGGGVTGTSVSVLFG